VIGFGGYPGYGVGLGFCRYYMGLRGSEKPCEWVYMSLEAAKLIHEAAGTKISRQNVWRYAKRHSLVAPKYTRKVAWRLMIKAMSREAARSRYMESFSRFLG